MPPPHFQNTITGTLSLDIVTHFVCIKTIAWCKPSPFPKTLLKWRAEFSLFFATTTEEDGDSPHMYMKPFSLSSFSSSFLLVWSKSVGCVFLHLHPQCILAPLNNSYNYSVCVFCIRYRAIVKYKTAFYSFYLPVALAMYMVRYSMTSLLRSTVDPLSYTLNKGHFEHMKNTQSSLVLNKGAFLNKSE